MHIDIHTHTVCELHGMYTTNTPDINVWDRGGQVLIQFPPQALGPEEMKFARSGEGWVHSLHVAANKIF